MKISFVGFWISNFSLIDHHSFSEIFLLQMCDPFCAPEYRRKRDLEIAAAR